MDSGGSRTGPPDGAGVGSADAPGDAAEVITPDQVVPPPGRAGGAVPHGRAPTPGGARARRRRETVVLAVVGVAVVAVGVAAMALGADDGGPPLADATTTTGASAADGTDPTGPIVGPSGVVGWWSGADWVPRAEGDLPDGGVDVRIVGLGGAPTRGRAVTVAEECASQRAAGDLDVSVPLDPAGDGPPPIAVAGVPNPVPRPVEQFDPGAPTYRRAAAEVAAGLGATTPPTVVQVLRADLDGSGTKEVVVAASHLADLDAPAEGDWSVVFARRVTGDGVATDVLASSTTGRRGQLDHVRVSSLADLNADGTMELVLDGRSTDGGRWTAVHALDDDGVPVEVLREGCDG